MSVLRFILKIPEYVLIGMVLFYRRFISPLKPPTCRFHPTCSQYMILAIKKYGVFRGVTKGVVRICRCHPWSEGGEDWP